MGDKANKNQIKYSLLDIFKSNSDGSAKGIVEEANKMLKEIGNAKDSASVEYRIVIKDIIKEYETKMKARTM